MGAMGAEREREKEREKEQHLTGSFLYYRREGDSTTGSREGDSTTGFSRFLYYRREREKEKEPTIFIISFSKRDYISIEGKGVDGGAKVL